MVVFLNREGFEAALPDVSAAAVVPMVAADVRRHQPLHPASEVAVLIGPEHQVKVVGHQAVAQDPHPQTLARRLEETDEGVVICRLMKHLSPAVPAIQDVITPIPERGPCSAWHPRSLPPRLTPEK